MPSKGLFRLWRTTITSSDSRERFTSCAYDSRRALDLPRHKTWLLLEKSWLDYSSRNGPSCQWPVAHIKLTGTVATTAFGYRMPNEEVPDVALYDTKNLLLGSFVLLVQHVCASLSIVWFGDDLLQAGDAPCNSDNTIETILADRLYKSTLFPSILKVVDWRLL